MPHPVYRILLASFSDCQYANHSPGQENNNTCRRITAVAEVTRKVLISLSDLCVVVCRTTSVVQLAVA